MSIDVVLSFSGIHPSSRPVIARTLELVPFVSAGLLESCDIGVGREPASLLLRAHLSESPRSAAVIARLSELVERANGVAQHAAGDAPSGAAALLERAQLTDRAIAPAALAKALERALEALDGDRGEGRPRCAASPRDAPPPPRRVLLIDDLHDDGRTAIADAIRGGGFDLTVLGDQRGMSAAELISADLVVLTTADPACAEARLRTCRAAGPRELPVLVVSAAPPAGDPRLLQAGADVIVSSGVAPRELLDTVRALLDGAIPPAAAPDAAGGLRPSGGRVVEASPRPDAGDGAHRVVELVRPAT